MSPIHHPGCGARAGALPRLRRLLATLMVTVFVAHADQLACAVPRTLAIPAQDLVASRARLAAGDPATEAACNALRAQADALLLLKPTSVLEKKFVPASGDKHDYFSMAPYWWPDPTKPDGLPYIRRDGLVNPASLDGTDTLNFVRTLDAVSTLGVAYWYTRDERYAAKALELTRVWFLDPATRMNPNFQHAQAIPGVTPGRGIGLIDARAFTGFTDGLVLLVDAKPWTAGDHEAIRAWLSAYYQWLTTSKNGRDESAEQNNHGSWYDLQAAHLALFLGKDDDARRIIGSVPGNRIARQIDPDGSQPFEFRRTRSMHYVLFNTEALVALADLGERVGVDVWGFTTPDGRNLHTALRVIAPYVDPNKTWMKEDLDRADRDRIVPLLASGLRHFDEPHWRSLLHQFGHVPSNNELWRIWTVLP